MAKTPNRQLKTASQRTRKVSLLWSGSNLRRILTTLARALRSPALLNAEKI